MGGAGDGVSADIKFECTVGAGVTKVEGSRPGGPISELLHLAEPILRTARGGAAVASSSAPSRERPRTQWISEREKKVGPRKSYVAKYRKQEIHTNTQ